MKTDTIKPENLRSDYEKRTAIRLLLGEAWMMCNECGSKLWSFDGDKDGSRKCPYKDRYGNCEPEAR